MTTYNTGNPIGSTDARDLYDNAQNLDNFANGASASYTDRLGVSRRSLAGIDSAADNVLNAIGYAVPVSYAGGISLTLTSQTVDYNGVVYAPLSSALPFTTSSWGTDAAKFRAIQVTDADLITYNPAGTGAVERTVQAELRDTIKPQQFGVIGSSDDTAAFNTMIAWLNANPGATVRGVPGTYTVGKLNAITAANTTLLFDGVVLKSKADSLTADNESLLTITGDKSRVIGLKIDGNQAAYTAGAGCQLLTMGGSGHRVESVSVFGSPGRGAILNVTKSQFIDCHFDDNANLGMEQGAASHNQFTNCTWDRNGYGFKKTRANPADLSHDFAAFGFALRFRSHHITFVNCTANDNGRDGMNVNQGSYAIKFIGCDALRNDDGGFTIASDSTAPGIPGDGEACYDLEFVDCEGANNYTGGLVAYQTCHNVTVTGGRYYNNNRVAGKLAQASSYYSGIYFAGGSTGINIDTKAYDDRQKRVITAVNNAGLPGAFTVAATGWVVGTKNYYPRVAIYSATGTFKGYANISNETVGSTNVSLSAASFHSISMTDGAIVVGDYISQRVQHNGAMLDNNCVGQAYVDGFGHEVGPINSTLQGHNLLSSGYSGGQNVSIKGGRKDGVELLTNGTFDANTTGWAFAFNGGGSATVHTGAFKRSAGSLALVSVNGIDGDGSLIASSDAYVQGAFVEFSGWAYAAGPGDVSFLLFWDFDGYKASTVSHPGGSRWVHLRVCVRVPEGSTGVFPRIVVAAGKSPYVDNLSMRVMEMPSDSRENSPVSRYLPY